MRELGRHSIVGFDLRLWPILDMGEPKRLALRIPGIDKASSIADAKVVQLSVGGSSGTRVSSSTSPRAHCAFVSP